MSAPVARRTDPSSSPPLVLLVLQADKYDWTAIMRTAASKGGARPTRDIGVVQTSWEHIHVGPCSNEAVKDRDGRLLRYGQVTVQVAALFRDGDRAEQQPRLTITPDFVLVRNEPTSPHSNHRAQLLGLLYANLPSLNSLRTILTNCDRPAMHAALHRVRAQRFRDQPPTAFPLIPQDFYPSPHGFFYGRSFPAVIKFGSAHAGLGKLRVANHHDMRDVQGLLSSTKEGFATGEPFVEAEKDLRIQMIGARVRAYERRGISGGWKTNVGSADVVEVGVTAQFRQWCDAAATMFGQDDDDRMDILTVDAVVSTPHATTGESRTFILEVNGTSSGLMPEHEDEDNMDIAALVLQKMKQIYR